jgi:signal transduction histidine kinase
LSQVVTTLVREAVRHSPDGGQIAVISKMHSRQVEVSVRDQGQGVRADFDNPLFGRDDLYANNPIRRVIGTGLGMGMIRQIVAMHGGRIWIDRLDGIGSEAHITLPIEMSAPRVGRLETVVPQAS